MSENKSSSKFQQEIELIIAKQFVCSVLKLKTEQEAFGKTTLINKADAKSPKVQLDIYIDAKEAIIGEVYVTELPFNSGRRRKFQSDILKLITIEKARKKAHKKYVILTISESKDFKASEFVKHSDENCFIPNDSWINLAIKEFDINLLYYVLSKDYMNQLNGVRINQTQGMMNTKG